MTSRLRDPRILFLIIVTALSFLTYFWKYWEPNAVYWDENYHVASAEKYLNGVYFMEQHPPLGKLLIAAGEKILNRNAVDSVSIGTDYATNFPAGFSFAGFRFFPALLAWLTAPLLYLIFFRLTKRPLASALLSFLYIFDNALIVHLRGAMLEGTLLFFLAAAILCFVALWQDEERGKMRTHALWFGVALGCVFTTKLLGLIAILLVPAILFRLWQKKHAILPFVIPFACAFALTYVAVWQTHFALGRTVNPALPDAGYYQASKEYREVLAKGATRSLLHFPLMLRDSLKFVPHYNRGTPRLDLCKPEENGSPFYFWPLGARAISYRWETPNGDAYRYLYLQSNPVVWWSGLLGILVSLGLVCGSLFGPASIRFKNPLLLATFVGLYACYMIAISRIDRVMYLYHYFIPLFFTFIVLGLLYMEIDRIGNFHLTERRKTLGLLTFAFLIFASYEFYRPLTYYEPISKAQFERRAFFPLWELTCVGCKKESGLVVPR